VAYIKMAKNQKSTVATQTATTETTTTARSNEGNEKKQPQPTVSSMYAQAEKTYKVAVEFVQLPHDENKTVTFTKQNPVYNPVTGITDLVPEHKDVVISGTQINDASVKIFGMAKNDLMSAISSVDSSKVHLLGMVTLKARNKLKRTFNPFL
jgi:hypothetical protein